MYAPAMTAATVEKPLDLAYIRSLSNPERKLAAVTELIRAAEHDVAVRGLRRNAAAVILYLDSQDTEHPIAPKTMWRDTIDVSRSLWHKILDESSYVRQIELSDEVEDLQREIGSLPAERVNELPELAKQLGKVRHRLARVTAQVQAITQLRREAAEQGLDLLAIARDEAKAVRQAEADIEEAKPIRDEVAYALMNRHGMANAQVARITGLSTARVAQLRLSR